VNTSLTAYTFFAPNRSTPPISLAFAKTRAVRILTAREVWRVMRITFGAALASLLLITLSAAGEARAAIRKHTDIPPQPLAQALTMLAKERNFEVLYRSNLVRDVRTEGAVGELTAEEALRRLLSGTALTYRFLSEDTVTIVSTASAAGVGETAQAGKADGPDNVERKGQRSFWDRFQLAQVDQGQAAAAGVALAQSSSSQNETNQPNLELQEVIVTARRREESVQHVPISISALSTETLEDLNIQTFRDIASVVPGISLLPPSPVNQDGGDIAVRGIYREGGPAPTTQIYIDDTPISIRTLSAAPSATPLPYIFDLERVEVLRGPQGTLFGASAMGGVIRYITPPPSLSATSGTAKVDIGYTEHGEPSYELGAAYGAPLFDGTVGFRASAWGQYAGGFIDREDYYTGQIVEKNINHAETDVARAALVWSPTDALSITPAFYIYHRHSANPNSAWVDTLPNDDSGKPLWGGIEQPLTEDLRLGSLAIHYSFGGVRLDSYTSYLDRELDATNDLTHFFQFAFTGTPFYAGLEDFTSHEHNMSFTHAWVQEVRLSSNDPKSRVNWVAGLFYRHALTGLSQAIPEADAIPEALGQDPLMFFGGIPNYPLNGESLSSYTTSQTTDISEAAFVDVNLSLTSHLKLDAGVRIEHSIVQDQENFVAGPLNGVPPTNQVLPEETENPVTPRLSLTYQITDDNMVYASAAKGYRPGGGNTPLSVGNPLCEGSLHKLGLSSVPLGFTSDKLWSYELGTKNLFLNKRLAIDGSIYYVNWTEVQTSVNLPTCFESFTANLGKEISQGFDLQLTAIVTEQLKVGAYVGYTNIYYPNAAYSVADQLLHGAGDKLPYVSPWMASANAEYSLNAPVFAPDMHPYARVDFRWTDAQSNVNPNAYGYDPGVHPNEAYSTLNLRFGVKNGRWDASAYVDNATNANPRIGHYHDIPGEPLYFVAVLRPRTFGLTGWYRF